MATLLTPKSTAALLRSILRQAFPATTFSIRTSRGSMASSVTIRWTDGPSAARVAEIADAFRCGSFDGMTDSFAYATGADRFLLVDGETYERGCRYVFTSRTVSPALQARCAALVAAYYGLEVPTCTANGIAATAAQDAEARTRTGFYWSSLIHQAAEDRSRFTFTAAA